MAIKWYVKAPVSEYVAQDGTSKKRYLTVGIVTETKKGDLMLKLEMIPLLGLKEGSFWAYLNVPEDKVENKQTLNTGGGVAGFSNIEEDIPF